MARTARKISVRRLSDLWDAYCQFRSGQVAPSTYQRDYQKITRRLAKMRQAAYHLDSSLEIRDWLLQTYSVETARRTLQQFSACLRWAEESDMVAANPFRGLQRHLRPKRPSEKAWAAFTATERDVIILAFEREHPFYAPWVKFLFWTGARPEEAAALTWGDVSPSLSEVLINKALPVDMKEVQSTKNYRATRFPCNHRLQRLLQEIQPIPAVHDAYLFPGRDGGRINYHNFQTRQWRPLVKQLESDGQIAFYLSQYACRHTWITLALQHLSTADVSYLARVSPKVLYEHYADRSRSIVIPEF